LEDRRGARLLEPARELLERIGDHVRLAQAALAVLLPHAGQVVHRSHLRAALLAAARADWQAEGLASAPNLREVTRRCHTRGGRQDAAEPAEADLAKWPCRARLLVAAAGRRPRLGYG